MNGAKKLLSFDEPIANSSMLVLPIQTIPASSNFLTTVASYGAAKFSSIFDPHVVVECFVQKISLWAIGIPVKKEPAFCFICKSASELAEARAPRKD